MSISNDELANPDRTMRVLAVIFEDGTAEGERSEVEFIRVKRLGRFLEDKRIRGLLDAPRDLDAASAWDLLEDQIGKRPDSPEQALAQLQGTPQGDLDPVRTAIRSGAKSVAFAFLVAYLDAVSRKGARQ
jgi:hypothetical protein